MATEAEIRWAMLEERNCKPTIEELVAEDCRQKREAERNAPPQRQQGHMTVWTVILAIITFIGVVIIWRAIFRTAFGRK